MRYNILCTPWGSCRLRVTRNIDSCQKDMLSALSRWHNYDESTADYYGWEFDYDMLIVLSRMAIKLGWRSDARL